ncbi:AAA family ATPase [Kovacikia minuta CCNUW1]|uniref:AAA family ATPase n=1 Tax=Kovacikia minuta TaxID=2931930 RepID=UPI001CCDF55B|nr:AAA family ATPase [Kovacikia minuta]UBF28311.1 AAA family ATPase [Kovacikia minuta CCNUW1]
MQSKHSVQSTDLHHNAVNRLLDEIYTATISGTAELELPQLARWSGIPVETLNDWGKQLVESKLDYDLEAEEFGTMIERYRKIDQIVDPGLRTWKLQSLARKYKRPLCYLTDAYNKALINQQPVQPLTVAEFKALHDQEVNWLVPGWIPESTTLLLHADGGVGKTLFAYQLMECVLYGKPWNGYPVKHGKVLLVQTDEPTIVTNERIDIRGIRDDAPLKILSDWQVEGLSRLEKHIEGDRPSLVIVDSLTTINRNSIFSENDTEYARPLLELAAIANKYGCVVIIIHHSNAEGGSRGTRAIYNSVSEVWGMSLGQSPSDRLMRVQKTRLGRPPGRYKFQFDDDDFSFTYLGEDMGDDGQASEIAATHEDRIRLWLYEDDQRERRWSTQEISEYLGIAKHSARKACYELWAKGLIRRVRPKGERAWFYFAGSNRELESVNTSSCDPSDRSDRQEVIALNAIQGSALMPSDRSDRQNSGNFTNANGNLGDHFDHLALKPSEGKTESAITCRDHLSDREGVIENDDRSSDRKTEKVEVHTSFEKDEVITVFSDRGWERGSYIKTALGPYPSLLTGREEPCHWVRVRKSKRLAANSDIRRVE